jgi:hypothetical protein
VERNSFFCFRSVMTLSRNADCSKRLCYGGNLTIHSKLKLVSVTGEHVEAGHVRSLIETAGFKVLDEIHEATR